MMIFWKKSLMAQLVTYFLLLSLVTISLVAYLSLQQAEAALKDAVYNRLEVTAALKEDDLNQWVDDRRRDLLVITQLPEIKTQATILLNHQSSHPEYQDAYRLLAKYLTDIATVQPNLQEIFILSKTNKVLVSTDKKNENRILVVNNYSYVPSQLTGTFTPNFYPDPITSQPKMTFRTPLGDEAGKPLGTLATHLNLKRIDDIIRQDADLHNPAATYLVGNLSTRNVFISGGESDGQEFTRGVHSKGIDDAMNAVDGKGLYDNYRGEPVIGVYHWLDSQDLVLLAEISQKEAFRPAHDLAITIILVGVTSAGLLAVGVYLIARQITRPILAVAAAAAALEAAKFKIEELTDIANRADEVGVLARVFQRMAREVYAREQRLKQQVQELKIFIDEAKRQKSVSEITENDFFQDLSARAQDLRKRREQRSRTRKMEDEG